MDKWNNSSNFRQFCSPLLKWCFDAKVEISAPSKKIKKNRFHDIYSDHTMWHQLIYTFQNLLARRF